MYVGRKFFENSQRRMKASVCEDDGALSEAKVKTLVLDASN